MDPKDVGKHFKSGFWMEPKYDGERIQIHKKVTHPHTYAHAFLMSVPQSRQGARCYSFSHAYASPDQRVKCHVDVLI
eukprot:3644142-Rhodomonas_salina.1